MLAALLGGRRLHAAEDAPALLSLVGDDAGVCIELHDLETNLKDFLRSEAFRRMSETRILKAWRSGADFGRLKTAIGHVERLTGKPLGETAADLFGRSVILAAYSNGTKEPMGVLLTRTRSPQVLDAALATWNRVAAKDSVTELTFRGRPYFRRTPAEARSKRGKQAEKSFYYVKLGAVFALSDQAAAIQDVITRSRQNDSKSLAESKRYQAARKSLTGNPVATMYLNPRAWDEAIKLHRDGAGANPLMERLWTQCRSVMAGVRLDGGFVAEVVVDVDADGLPAAWTRFAEQTAGASAFLSRIPGEAVLAIAGKYDPSLVLNMLKPDGDADEERNWGALHTYGRIFLLGIDISNDVFPNLKPSGGLYVVPRATSDKSVFPFDGLAALEVVPPTGDPAGAADRFRDKLERGLENGVTVLATFYNLSRAKRGGATRQPLAKVQSKKRGGVWIRWIDGVENYRPAIALTRRFLVVASTPELIDDFIAPTRGDRLQANESFRRWKRAYFPNGNQLVFVNVRSLREHVISVRPVLVSWLSGKKAEAKERVGTRLERALDLLQVLDGAFAAAQVEKSRVRLVVGGVVKPAGAPRQ